MKKFSLLLSAFCIAIACSAQLKTFSVNDSNQDGKVNVGDVNSIINEIIGTVSSSKVVSADSLASLLLSIDSRLAAIEKKLGISDEPVTPTPAPAATHAYVEIGGLKWATMNLGATTVAGSPSTCYGDYYAWGETEPRYTSITITGANSASFGGWSSSHSSGYSSSDYPSYTGTTLDAEHDAATKNWGSDWRTPTHEDYVKLYEACGGTGNYISSTLPIGTTTTTAKGIYWCNDYDGVKGLLFSDGTNKVFFPAAGDCSNASFGRGGYYGYYWSSSLYTSYTNIAYSLNFYSSFVKPSNFNFGLCLGFSVRPVSE